MKNRIYDLWKNSKYHSVKHGNYFEIYEELFSEYVGKKITFVTIGVLSGARFLCGEITLEKMHELLV